MEETRTHLPSRNHLAVCLERLGMSHAEIEAILQRRISDSSPGVELGPRHYPGGFYGAVSIRDF